nr:vegetative cell wall protein gp1-like [Chlorocebus sabaeus]
MFWFALPSQAGKRVQFPLESAGVKETDARRGGRCRQAEGEGRRPPKVLPRGRHTRSPACPGPGEGKTRLSQGRCPPSPAPAPRAPRPSPPRSLVAHRPTHASSRIPFPTDPHSLPWRPRRRSALRPLPTPALCLLPWARAYSEKQGKGVTVRTDSSRSKSCDTSDPTYAQARTRTSWPPPRPGRPSLRPHRAVNTAARSLSPSGPGPRADCGALTPPCGLRRDMALGWAACLGTTFSCPWDILENP